MKKYETPKVEIVKLDVADIIQTSAQVTGSYDFTQDATYNSEPVSWLNEWN